MSQQEHHFYRWQQRDLLLRCYIQPGAKTSEFCGEHDQRLKIRIAAPAQEGKANSAVVAFVAKQFAVSKTAVSIVAGGQSRQKTLKIASPVSLPKELDIPSPA